MNRAKRPCKQPGCPELVQSGYCDKHQKNVVTESPFRSLDTKKTDEERSFYSSSAWTRVSKLFRISHPFCAECEQSGIITASDMVHHVVSRDDLVARGDNPLSWRWLEALCNSCHLKHLRAKRK